MEMRETFLINHHTEKEMAGQEETPAKSRFRKLSLRVKRRSLAFFREIATHLSGARNDIRQRGFLF
jgi:hypothetical protein